MPDFGGWIYIDTDKYHPLISLNDISVSRWNREQQKEKTNLNEKWPFQRFKPPGISLNSHYAKKLICVIHKIQFARHFHFLDFFFHQILNRENILNGTPRNRLDLNTVNKSTLCIFKIYFQLVYSCNFLFDYVCRKPNKWHSFIWIASVKEHVLSFYLLTQNELALFLSLLSASSHFLFLSLSSLISHVIFRC